MYIEKSALSVIAEAKRYSAEFILVDKMTSYLLRWGVDKNVKKQNQIEPVEPVQ